MLPTKQQTAVCVSLAFTNVPSLLPGSLHSDGWTGFRLRRLYFVWVCRELQSFYWFAELLCAVHHKVRTKAARCCLLLTFTQDVWEPKLTLQVQLDCLRSCLSILIKTPV